MDMFCRPSKTAIPIHAVSKAGLKKWLSRQSATVKKWVTSSDFKADPGTHLTLAGKDGALAGVVLGVNANFDMWDYGGLAKTLPPGKYALTADLGAEESTRAAIAFGLGVYQFTRYKSESETIKVQLAWPKDCDQAAARQTVEELLGQNLELECFREDKGQFGTTNHEIGTATVEKNRAVIVLD